MHLTLKARQNRQFAIDAIDAKHANVFADAFGQHRRPRPGKVG